MGKESSDKFFSESKDFEKLSWLSEKSSKTRQLPGADEPPSQANLPSQTTISVRSLHNLPFPSTSFIGRDSQIKEILWLLHPASPREDGGPRPRLLTLIGPGGSGKTRLALEVAHRLIDEFTDGIWWVDLAALSDPAFVPQTIASTLGIGEQPGRPLLDTLSDSLQYRHVLLLLDNCEHLLAACKQLAEFLLQKCSSLYILTTSVFALNIQNEMIWPVLPLSTPTLLSIGVRENAPIVQTKQYESVQLFAERAASISSGYTLTDQNVVSIAQICHRLDGIPLAIELAAARVKLLTAQQIAGRLDKLFSLLTRSNEVTLSRHQTLHAAVEWSYQLLSEPDQILLRRLSVFTGSFTLEDVEALCSGNCLDTEDILDALCDLVDKSLVMIVEREPQAESRYRLLEMIRQYGQERLEEAGETQQFRDRHLAFYLDLAEHAEPELRRANQVSWLDRLEAEYGNLREALAWAIATQDAAREIEYSVEDTGLRLAASLSLFWEIEGYYSEGRTWLERALESSSVFPSIARAKTLTGLGTMVWHQGNYSQALHYHEAALEAFRERGYVNGIAFALNNIAAQYLDLGLYERARSVHQEALAYYREAQDAWGIGLVLCNLGFMSRSRGEVKQAISYLQKALPYIRQSGDKFLLGMALENLGELAHDQGDLTQVVARYSESISLFEAFGKRAMTQDWVLRMRGDVAQVQGNYEEAAQIFLERLQLCRVTGDKSSLTETLERLAQIMIAKERLLDSVQLFSVAEHSRKNFDIPLHLTVLPAYKQRLARLRTTLGEAAYNEAWAAGQKMTLEEAYSFAISQTLSAKSESLPTTISMAERLPSRHEADKQRYGGLTNKEREVASLVVQGKSNREIADQLFVSLKTVEAHITRILNKLGFTSRAQIAAWAVAKGLAEAPSDLDTLSRGS